MTARKATAQAAGRRSTRAKARISIDETSRPIQQLLEENRRLKRELGSRDSGTTAALSALAKGVRAPARGLHTRLQARSGD